MPKRKRDFEPSDGPKSSARQQRIDHKIAQGSIHLAHAFKVAKSFERQKLGRREKTARAAKNDKDVVRIESEIGALKTLDTSLSAHLFLHKTLSKIKAVAASDLFTVYLSAPPAPLQDVASQNIYARLCNSKPVKEAIATLLEGLLDAAHIQAQKKSSGRIEEDKLSKTVERSSNIALDRKSRADPAPGRDGVDIKESNEDVDGSGSEIDYGEFEHRLAASDTDGDEEDEDEFDSVADLERRLQAEVAGDRDDWSGSDEEEDPMSFDDDAVSDSGAASSDEDAGKVRVIAAASKSATRQSSAKGSGSGSGSSKPMSSLLLPSLTMGGYISASDGSDIEDIDEKPRKNRPGQRARQAIWEKKYGSKAKHLQQDSGRVRDQGWDMKRGATNGSNRGARARGAPQARLDDDSGGTRGSMSKNPKKDDSGKLHPSWEAAKLAKEKKAATAAAFAGKKISFD